MIATVLGVLALKLSKPITVPLFTAAFLIVLCWPLEARLERRIPRWLALLATILVVLLAAGAIVGAFVWSGSRVAERGPELATRVQQVTEDVVAWGRARNLPLPPAPAGAQPLAERLAPLFGEILHALYAALGLLGLVLAFFVLGLLEVRDFEAKVAERLQRRSGRAVLETAREIADRVRRHMLALTLTSAISGVLTGVFALAVGLELAALWGLTAFLLNYVPTLGPAVATLPPTLYALLQFGGIGRPAVVFLGIGAIQFLVGNFLDPKIEGRVLALSPVGVLFAIVFWGWLWGVLGAFLAVPLTAAVLLVCQRFEATRWVAALLSGVEGGRERGGKD